MITCITTTPLRGTPHETGQTDEQAQPYVPSFHGALL